MGRALGIWVITALAVAFAFWLVPGIDFIPAPWMTPDVDFIPASGQNAWVPIIIFAAVLAVLNAFVKPILQIVSLPISILTLGIFALVVNTAVIYLARWISDGLFGTELFIANFFSAFLASLIISVVSALLGALTGVKDKRQPHGTTRGGYNR